MDEILQALTDPENQPHQWIGDPEALRVALAQAAARSKRLWWVISIVGLGELLAFHGTEAEAEKARQNAIGIETVKRLADLTLNSDCVLITAAEDGMARQ